MSHILKFYSVIFVFAFFSSGRCNKNLETPSYASENEGEDHLGNLPPVSSKEKTIEVWEAFEHCKPIKELKSLLKANPGAIHEKAGDKGGTLLHLAVTKGNLEAVDLLIASGANKNAVDDLGRTPFLLAIKEKNFKMAERLLKHHKVNPHITPFNDPDLPMILAAGTNQIDFVKLLLSDGFDINAKHQLYNGSNLLHCLPLRPDVTTETIKQLISLGADVNAVDNDGCTPLYNAIVGGRLDVAEVFINSNANIEATAKGNYKALDLAIQKGNLQALKFLLDHGVNVNEKDYSGACALYRAVTSVNQNAAEMVQMLLNKGANVNCLENIPDLKDVPGMTLLHVAVERKVSNSVLNTLINSGKIPLDAKDHSGNTATHFAAMYGCVDALKCLKQAGANLNIRNSAGQTPLDYSIMLKTAATQTLIDLGADIKLCNEYGFSSAMVNAIVYGRDAKLVSQLHSLGLGLDIAVHKDTETPLFRAIYNGNIDLVKFLLDKNCPFANKYSVSKDGPAASPICVAAEEGHWDIVKLLLDRGDIDINSPSAAKDKAFTLMHWATSRGITQFAEILAQRGVNVNTQTETSGDSPLHFAVEIGNFKMVEWLLKNGANPELKNKNKQVPLDCAKRNHDKAMVKLLESVMKDPKPADKKSKYSTREEALADFEAMKVLFEKESTKDLKKLKTINGTKDFEDPSIRGKALSYFLGIIESTMDNFGKYISGFEEIKDAPVLLKEDLAPVRNLLNKAKEGRDEILIVSDLLHCLNISEVIDKFVFKAISSTNKEELLEACRSAVALGQLRILHYSFEYKDMDLQTVINMPHPSKYCQKNTLLHGAITHGDVSIVRYIMRHGADPNIKCDEGTAFDMATSEIYGNKEILDVLLGN